MSYFGGKKQSFGAISESKNVILVVFGLKADLELSWGLAQLEVG